MQNGLPIFWIQQKSPTYINLRRVWNSYADGPYIDDSDWCKTWTDNTRWVKLYKNMGNILKGQKAGMQFDYDRPDVDDSDQCKKWTLPKTDEWNNKKNW